MRKVVFAIFLSRYIFFREKFHYINIYVIKYLSECKAEKFN